jgi:hypothetical protein
VCRRKQRVKVGTRVCRTTCASAAASNASEETIGPLPPWGKRAGDDPASKRKRWTYAVCSKRLVGSVSESSRLSARSQSRIEQASPPNFLTKALDDQVLRPSGPPTRPENNPKRRPAIAGAQAGARRRAPRTRLSKPQLACHDEGPRRIGLRCSGGRNGNGVCTNARRSCEHNGATRDGHGSNCGVHWQGAGLSVSAIAPGPGKSVWQLRCRKRHVQHAAARSFTRRA